MDRPFYKKLGYLFFFLVFLGWCLVLFYSAIPLEFKEYIVEKNEVLLINANDTINLLSQDPEKSKFIFICSFYLGFFWFVFYISVMALLRDWHAFDVELPLYKVIPITIFSYIFMSGFFIFGLVFPGIVPRIDRLLWTGSIISNIFLVFFMVWQGVINVAILNFFYLIVKLIRGKSIW